MSAARTITTTHKHMPPSISSVGAPSEVSVAAGFGQQSSSSSSEQSSTDCLLGTLREGSAQIYKACLVYILLHIIIT